jgi:hypothetical protein
MNYSQATLALEGFFGQRWTQTLVSYESGNIPLPENRPTASESWLRFTLSGVGMGRRSIGRGEPWTRWDYLATHQLFVPPQTGHDIIDGYVSDLLTLWQDLDLPVPGAGARWVMIDPPFAPSSRREAEWFQTNITMSLQLEFHT